jgi:hypothetical protein
MAELSNVETMPAEPPVDCCCSAEQQTDCCEPSAKTGCCGHEEGCGCDADIRREVDGRGDRSAVLH